MGLFGTENGRFFFVPTWVNPSEPAGYTSLSKIYGVNWLYPFLTLRFFFYSPNLVWFLIALSIYIVFPYDFEAASAWRASFLINRLMLNFSVVLGYTGFWYISLFVLGWAKRKFNPRYMPSPGTMFHNIFYTSLGILQWTMWEMVFAKIYADNKLEFIADSEAFSSWGNIARMVLWTIGIPFWREFHFYFAHRLIHIRVLYKYVHSLHHRNVDPEPFSGLCMHPVEHLYYFSCIAPSLFFYMSPFHFLWNGIHLLLSPAASHSGWEDHWQSDQYHYLHHTKFECNYGTMGVPLDKWFGTYRDKIGDSSTYHGQATEPSPTTMVSQSGGLLPSIDQIIFNVGFYLTCFFVGWRMVWGDTFGLGNAVYAWLLAVGQILLGLLLRVIVNDRLSIRWPFHKEVVGTFGFHLVIGFLMTAVPVYQTVMVLLN